MDALIGFLCGFILYFGSIYLICWNERRAVRECQYLDNIRKESNCKVIENGAKIEDEKLDGTLSYIVNGELTVEEEAIIPDLNIDFKKQIDYGEKILFFKTNFDKFTINEVRETETVIVNGEEREEEKFVTIKEWSVFYQGQDKLERKIYHGKVKFYYFKIFIIL